MKKMSIIKKLSATAVVAAMLVSMFGMTVSAAGKATLEEQAAIAARKAAEAAAALAEQQEIVVRKSSEKSGRYV